MTPPAREDVREARLTELREQAASKGIVSALGVRAEGSPLPKASPQNGYYQLPMMKEPQWTPLIPLYFFVGGATGSLGVIGSLADVLGGEEELARTARTLALGGAALSSVLLVIDLGRPSRFLNMLRVFKPQSTMSMGSWILSAFSLSAGASSSADLLQVWLGKSILLSTLRGAGRVGSVLFGMPFHNYTGVLIGTTVIPVWNKRVHALPREFGMSGLQAGVSILELLGHEKNNALNALALLSTGVETWESIDLMRSDDVALGPAKRGFPGFLLHASAMLSGPVPMVLRVASLFVRRKKTLRRMAAWSGIIGSMCMRYAWVRAGTISSRDWRLPLEIEATAPPGISAPAPYGFE